MSNGALRLLAGAGAKDDPVYVDDVFSCFLYTGDGSTRSITNGIDLSGEGGLVWIKNRDNSARHHGLFDTVRGATKALYSNQTWSEGTESTGLTAFNSNGFSLGSSADFNGNNESHVGWTFRKQPGFFDIVTYTGDGTTSRDISHNLETAPGAIIIKRTDNTSDWTFQHRYNNNYVQYLNDSAAQSDSGATFQFNSTNFKVVGPPSGLADAKCTNVNGATYVAYLFAHDAQDFGTDSDEAIIKCGSYTGNGSTTGPVIDLGFEPQFLILKNVTTGLNWLMFDTMRGLTTGGNDEYLKPSASDSAGNLDFLSVNSTGFQIDSSYNDLNKSGDTHVYVAIRRPHKPASEFAATDLLDVSAYSGAGAGTSVTTGFPVDLTWVKRRSGGTANHEIWDRLRGPRKYLFADAANSEGTAFSSADQWLHDYMDKFIWSADDGFAASSGQTYCSWNWRRAPGFFDVVAYTGTGSTRTVSHNLGAVPEMMWVKNRTSAYSWSVYHSGIGATKYLTLNTDVAPNTNAEAWNDTAPTSSVFTVKDDGRVNLSSASHIAYLFATVDGISKVGSYSGTGSDVNVDCGFSAGARFVLVKRTDSTGNWYVWDSVRGIVAGNDPYLLADTNAAEVTNTDYIDPLSSGFTITSSAPADLNTSGGTYIFLAIA